MAQPTELPEWATSEAGVVEPDAQLKIDGWQPGDQPPAETFNWYKNLVYKWVQYLAGPTRALEDICMSSWRMMDVGGYSVDLRAIAASHTVHTRKICAVGATGGIISSVDDISLFLQRTPGSAYAGTFLGIAWDPSLLGFAAVGSGEEIQTSADTITWTRRNNGSDTLNSVASNGAGTFVACGANGKIYSSTALATWTSRTSAFGTDDNAAVAFGAGLFVIVGVDGNIQTSPDGVTWTARTSGTSEDLFRCHFGGGRFVVHAETGYLESTDGITWTFRTVDYSNWINTVFAMWVTENALYLGLSVSGEGTSVAVIYPEAPEDIDHIHQEVIDFTVFGPHIDQFGIPYMATKAGQIAVGLRLPPVFS